jgi:hypothetical protein
MHPVFTQVPPNLWRSIIATVFPAAANRAASDGPAWPVPIMSASKCFIIVVGVPPLYGSCCLWLPSSGLAVQTRDNVGGIPARPVVLRRGIRHDIHAGLLRLGGDEILAAVDVVSCPRYEQYSCDSLRSAAFHGYCAPTALDKTPCGADVGAVCT